MNAAEPYMSLLVVSPIHLWPGGRRRIRSIVRSAHCWPGATDPFCRATVLLLIFAQTSAASAPAWPSTSRTRQLLAILAHNSRSFPRAVDCRTTFEPAVAFGDAPAPVLYFLEWQEEFPFCQDVC